MSVLKLKNTWTGEMEVFQPLNGNTVTMYSCGPTVYSFAHIGNFRSFLMSDILRRTLELNGYEVRHVMNITDVGHMTVDDVADAEGEDKMGKTARELGWDPWRVAKHFEDAFVEDAKALRLKLYQGEEADDPELHPRAARHVAEMLAMIQKLIERQFAYVDSQGQVYFDIQKFPEYGELSGKKVDELEAGKRVAVSGDKRDPRDFYLWKVDEKHLMQWDPHSAEGWPDGDWEHFKSIQPDGVDPRIKPGFPGWHVECSAMARAHLGGLIDIHTGGEDNIFPHHECEVAQSYGAYATTVPGPHGAHDADQPRKTFARYWVHGRHLLVDNRKMSKSDGTFYTVRDLMDPVGAERPDVAEKLTELGFKGGRVSANVLRYALIANPYTQPMNFGFDSLQQANASVERLQGLFDRLREVEAEGTPDSDLAATCETAREGFLNAMNDNLNVPNALAVVFGLVNELNQRNPEGADAYEARQALDYFDSVLDVLVRDVRTGLITRKELDAAVDQTFDVDALVAGSFDADNVQQLILARHAARKSKDFGTADKIRDALKAANVAIDDTPRGTRWSLG